MPSLRASIIGLALTALIQLSSASPMPRQDRAESACHSAPAVPTESPNALPAAPPAGQTFQYAVIGRGVQNYTCASASSTPVALGAVATLYDGSELACCNEAYFNAIPPRAVYSPPGASPGEWANKFVIGHHFFGADGTPTFDLYAVNKILYAAKAASEPAPADANKGPAGTGAVPWLQLTAKAGKPSVGLQTVYRVETAGGNAPASCTSEGVISVQYAAEYWFYN